MWSTATWGGSPGLWGNCRKFKVIVPNHESHQSVKGYCEKQHSRYDRTDRLDLPVVACSPRPGPPSGHHCLLLHGLLERHFGFISLDELTFIVYLNDTVTHQPFYMGMSLVPHSSWEVDTIIIPGVSEKISYLPKETQLLSQARFWNQGY